MNSTKEIKESFLNYFVEQNHLLLENKGLIPNKKDTSALFINSGVHAIKLYIIGEEKPPKTRLTSNQSCIRTIDIDRVGKNDRTLTYFNMLGSWSIGDYWKEEALEYAYTLLTERLNLNPEKFAITVFQGDNQIPIDEESIKIWKSMGIKENQIYKKSAEDNLWSMGNTGPCGPCTEVFIDRGEEYGKDSTPGDESPRFIEIWNAGVFMTYNRNEDGSLDLLIPKVIDTGAGLERMAVVLQNKSSVYDVFPLDELMNTIEQYANNNKQEEVSKRIISDHLRASTFIADEGVIPSNKLQGYVLRRLLRKVIYNSESLGIENFDALTKDAINILNQEKQIKNPKNIEEIFSHEYHVFKKTLNKGNKKLEEMLQSGKEISGSDVYKLYETYGFPTELTKEIATSKGINIDMHDYEKAKKKHIEISKKGSHKQFQGGLAEITDNTIKYHTTTHLLHKALKIVLGEQVSQAGSNITSERLRFDFYYDKTMTKEEIKKVEEIINEKIKEDLKVTKETMTYNEAKERGALALYGKEKYTESVSIYTISNYSIEVCGGPHVNSTSEIGVFKIEKEKSSSKGVRRIYAKIID